MYSLLNLLSTLGLKRILTGNLHKIAYFLLYMGLLCLLYFVCALRTNIVFVVIFAALVPTFGVLAGAYWQLAQGNAALAARLQIVRPLPLTLLSPHSLRLKKQA
jgi:uncharacterized protein involved in cysteine biosynthesis